MPKYDIESEDPELATPLVVVEDKLEITANPR